jgi:chaperone modulatory protein CbpM
MDKHEYSAHLGIDITIVEIWISEGWLRPQSAAGRHDFRAADIARGRLIVDLMQTMGVNDAGVDIAIDLIDQIHGMRAALTDISAVLAGLDEETRQRVLRALEHG